MTTKKVTLKQKVRETLEQDLHMPVWSIAVPIACGILAVGLTGLMMNKMEVHFSITTPVHGYNSGYKKNLL